MKKLLKSKLLEERGGVARLEDLTIPITSSSRLQRDFENGIENNDFHRVNSRGELEYFNSREEWEHAEAAALNNQLASHPSPEATEPKMVGRDQSAPLKRPDAAHGSKMAAHPPSSTDSSPVLPQRQSVYEAQRAAPPARKPQENVQQQQQDDSDEDDEDSDLEDLAGRIQMHEETSIPKTGLTRNLSNDFLPRKKTEKESHQASTEGKGREQDVAMDASLDPPGSVEQELKSLYEMIGMYQPETFELDHKLQPFLPDYIPCIGDIDPIIKISMPPTLSGQPLPESLQAHEYVGFVYLDEPNAQQSDPAVIDLALRAISLQETTKETNAKVRSIRLPPFSNNMDANKSAPHKALQNWIDTVADLQTKKNRPTGAASKGASLVDDDLEKLMAEWPSEIDFALTQHTIQLPTADIDLSLQDFARLCCTILDVAVKPVRSNYNGPRKQLVDSISSIFAVYLLFKNNQHFSGRV